MSVFEPVALDDFLRGFWPEGHISVSQVKQFSKCPEQFRRVRVLGHKARPSAALEWGSADHETAGFNYAEKITTEKDLPVAELQEHFVNGFEERVEALGGPTEIDWDGDKDFDGKTPEQGVAVVKDKGVRLVAAYREQIAQDFYPETVEEPLLFEPDGLGVQVKGFIDVVARWRNPLLGDFSPPMILERKTRSQIRAPKPEDIFQARVYQLARPLPAEFHISARPSGRVQTYDPFPVENPRGTVELLRSTLLEIATCHALYGPDRPWPGRGKLHDWSCGFCALKPTCPYWDPQWWPK